MLRFYKEPERNFFPRNGFQSDDCVCGSGVKPGRNRLRMESRHAQETNAR
jgi:hypothetical protein